MKRILVLGSLNMDFVTHVKRTPKIGETLLGDGFVEIPGGKGANQAAAIGKLGGNVSMLGMVGDDKYGKALLDNLKSNMVESSLILKSKSCSTGLAIIMVNEDADNSIVVIPGANFDLKVEQIKEQDFTEVSYLLAQLETPVEIIEKAFIMAKALNIITILNPAPAKKLSKELIANTDLLIPNETEFTELTGIRPDSDLLIQQGASILFKQGIREILLTRGKKGVYYINNENKTYISESYRVNAVDTTAAGDSFIGGILLQLSNDKNISEAIEFAMKVAAITVSKHGAQSSLPSLKEVEAFQGIKY